MLHKKEHIAIFTLAIVLVGCFETFDVANGATTTQTSWCTIASGLASWYSRTECVTKTNPQALMANGHPLDDAALTCAYWGVPFGSILRVTCAKTQKSVIVTVCDRGPARRLVRAGRVIDLTRAAFSTLAPLERGLVSVVVEKQGESND